MSMKTSDTINAKYRNNLIKTLELSEAGRILKKAFLRHQHPNASPQDFDEILINDILSRKNRSWQIKTR